MGGRQKKLALLCLAGTLALGLVALVWAMGSGSSEAQQGALHNCPQPAKWAIAVWDGPDGTETGQALATCGEAAVIAAYYLDPQTQDWLRWFAGRPLVSNLLTLDNMQGVLALGGAGASGPASAGSSAQQDAMQNCPQAAKWAISVWSGEDGTNTGDALSTCGAGAVDVAYSIDSNTQQWSRWFAARPDPDVSNLRTLNKMQGVMALGAVGAPTTTPTPVATFTSWHEIDVRSIWHPLGEEDRLSHLHECSRDRRTECVTAIMQDSGASRQAIEFFRTTGWFLGDFQEMGRVDLGSVVDPWRANENVQYAFLNGSPLVVHPEEEVQPVAIELDPNYDVLVAAFPNLFLWPGLGLFEALSTTEEGGQRFVIQFHLVDGCHACGTGYRARVAFDFGADGTYLGVGPLWLGLCWGGGPDVTPVSASIPACPLP